MKQVLEDLPCGWPLTGDIYLSVLHLMDDMYRPSPLTPSRPVLECHRPARQRKKQQIKMFLRSWVMLPPLIPQGGACSLEPMINGPTTDFPLHQKRGVVQWLARQQVREHPCGAGSALPWLLASHKASAVIIKAALIKSCGGQTQPLLIPFFFHSWKGVAFSPLRT